MPMPRLPETHHRKRATASPFQVNIKSATIAPTWNAAMKPVVIQPIGSRNVLSLVMLTVRVPFVIRSLVLISSVAAVMAGDCNTCVIREVCASYRQYKGTQRAGRGGTSLRFSGLDCRVKMLQKIDANTLQPAVDSSVGENRLAGDVRSAL